MRNNKKMSAGITLIALVITVIVLLILAGISIQMLTGDNGILTRAGQASEWSEIAKVEELANIELTDNLIGVKTGNEAQKGLTEILETLKTKGEVDAYGKRGDVSITGFNFGGITSVNVGTTETNKTKVMTAEFTGPQGTGAYYVQIKGKKYPISKINGRITIEKTAISTNDGVSAKLTSATSSDTDVVTVEVTGDDEITITGVATGETTITVKAKDLPDVTLTVNAKRSTALTVTSDTTGCTVSPTSITALEGDEVTLTATPASEKVFNGWYVGTNTTAISTVNPYNYQIPTGNDYVSSVTIAAKFEDNPSEIANARTDRVTYGKYVNYDINLGIGEDEASKASYLDDWKVFYDDGINIFIIAADYVPVSNSYLATAMTNMGAISADYTFPYGVKWTSSTPFKTYKSESATISSETSTHGAKDIFVTRPNGTSNLIDNKGFLGFWKAEMEKTGATKTIDGETNGNDNANARMIACLMDTKVWVGFAGGTLPSGVTGTAYAIGGPTLSMFVESWNVSRTTKLGYNSIGGSGFGYKVNIDGGSYSTKADLSEKADYTGIKRTDTNYTNDLYFPHTGNSEFINCSDYRLASPSANGTNYGMCVKFKGIVTYSSPSSANSGVRPVVCLPSEIGLKTNSNNSNLYDITNNEWDTTN